MLGRIKDISKILENVIFRDQQILTTIHKLFEPVKQI